jgi:hypothetical protein
MDQWGKLKSRERVLGLKGIRRRLLVLLGEESLQGVGRHIQGVREGSQGVRDNLGYRGNG